MLEQTTGLTQIDTDLQNIARTLGAILVAVKSLVGGQTYVTGTWVPALRFGGPSTGIAYSTQLGTFTQVGREMICRFAIVLTSKGSSSGTATIAGLPVVSNANATNAGAGGVVANYSGMSGLGSAPLLNVGAGSSAVSLLGSGAAATVALADPSFTNTASISGNFSYFV